MFPISGSTYLWVTCICCIFGSLLQTPIEGPMTGHTDNGMKIAQDTLVKMNERNFFLDPRTGSNLLLKAAGEKTGGYIVANMIWDLMLVRNILPTLAAVEAYYKGLKEREIPEDDPIEFKE
ncbi:pentatricopeptide repeat-containing protein At4g35850, mitochondrial isoform X1 [Arabidopsis lyrata subsp. lyrata]|uniref:pentatricopeptide repeat-containing protein At4g35850, mitochondrial isoform X1 n=2 Tax=Arabidopsis lyrata subsp. lyrata TaxID=81972 RepID=UPI000A29E24B|nr:pentatricopeptide repeat-containing protein At4g35850, mitochondrial isoform X1 [Arabidopsis lyrata subsp. lyrata]|eukprot:XP_020875062.1 pentatricopeptide repeat-containing protein At4g35850, mitochondrial isoform X1 [Arabidopsis lyrata subsp. lyrata]